MGWYINPTDGTTKESWLAKHGEPINQEYAEAYLKAAKAGQDLTGPLAAKLAGGTHLFVCLVDNGAFRAAGIAVDQRELEAFLQPHDQRPKQWFVVPKEDLKLWLPKRMGGADLV